MLQGFRSLVLVGATLLVACPPKPEANPAEKTPAPAAPGEKAPPAPGDQVPPGDQPASQPSGALDKGLSPETRDQIDPDGAIRRGSPLSPEPAMSVKDVLASADRLSGKTVKVSGKVTNVCQKKGCWMELEGEQGTSVRITAKDYKFFVPQSAVGKVAIVEGDLEVTTLSVEDAQHYEDERAAKGEAKKKITEPQKEIAVVAIGLEVKTGA